MKKMRVAVLGAGKIGRYHVREFSQLGADVVAILGSSKESSQKTAEGLEKDFGVKVRPYHVLEEMLGGEDLDAVSICTPPEMHEAQTRLCLEHGLHVMCEKPFVQTNKNYEAAKELFALAEKKGRILTVNTQWASIINYLRKHMDLDNLKSISIYMEAGEKGIDMIRSFLPHTNSVLVRLIPEGKAENIRFLSKTNETTAIEFKYGNGKGVCEVEYSFKFKGERPRQIIFSLNGESFRREIGSDYSQFFASDNVRFEIKDPLNVSIGMFLGACNGLGNLLVNRKEILENVLLAEQISHKYVLSS